MGLAFGTILLGAGASRRMGRPKLLLPWGPATVIGHLVGVWRSLDASPIAVVVAAGDVALERELDRLGLDRDSRITNPRPDSDMFHSITCAAQWSIRRPGPGHWVLALGDQPQIQAGTLARLLAFAADHPERVCQPARGGRGRHPIVFPAAVFHRLAASTGPTLRAFLETEAGPTGIARFDPDDPGLDADLDYPEDYERWRPPRDGLPSARTDA